MSLYTQRLVNEVALRVLTIVALMNSFQFYLVFGTSFGVSLGIPITGQSSDHWIWSMFITLPGGLVPKHSVWKSPKSLIFRELITCEGSELRLYFHLIFDFPKKLTLNFRAKNLLCNYAYFGAKIQIFESKIQVISQI